MCESERKKGNQREGVRGGMLLRERDNEKERGRERDNQREAERPERDRGNQRETEATRERVSE